MESLHNFLTEQSALCRERAASLTADDRRDEAVFEKIRGNVYDIFTAVLNTAQSQTDPMAFFRHQLNAIPANWESALEKARAHGDDAKMHTELLKLDTVRSIRNRMEGIV